MLAMSAPAKDADKEPVGIRCRKCGCRDLRVYGTVPIREGKVRRYRRCRHCGTKMTTIEQTAAQIG